MLCTSSYPCQILMPRQQTSTLFSSSTSKSTEIALRLAAPLTPKCATNATRVTAAQTTVEEFSVWRELRQLVWRNILFLLLGTGALVLSTFLQSRKVAELTAALSVKIMQYDKNTDPGKRADLLVTMWSMLKWQATVQALSFLGKSINQVVQRRIAKGLKLRLFIELLQKDISLFDAHKTGELTKCVEERVAKLASVLANTASGLSSLVTVPLTLYEMWAASPQLTQANSLVIFGAVGSMMAGWFFGLKRLTETIQKHDAAASACVTESFFGIRTVQSFAAGERLAGRYHELLEAPSWLEFTKDVLFQGIIQVFQSLEMLITVTTFFTGTRIMAEHSTGRAARLQVQELARFQELSGQLFKGLFVLAATVGSLGSTSGDVASVNTILRHSGSKLQAHGAAPPGCTGALRLLEVTFSYPSHDPSSGALAAKQEEATEGLAPERAVDEPVLRGLNLSFEPGKSTALVGKSGCGKSTVLALLQRFHDPNAGSVLLDGHPLPELDTRWLRRQLGKVEQEPTLFALSIADNIRLGRPDASDSEVEEAATRAQAHDFIMDSSHGYQTMVGEQGASLSGGQKQRLAIARALLMKPHVLILDEATSALDSATERKVVDAMAEVMQGRTTIVIAHRLSTVASADCIVVLDNGGVAESGTHQQLMERNGVYASLVHSQQDGFEH